MTPVVRILLVLNIGVYILQRSVPGITEAFEFIPAFAIIRPWTLISYMFVHAPNSLMHIGLQHDRARLLRAARYGPPGTGIEHVVADDAVLAGEVVAVGVGRAPEQLGDRGRDVDQPARRGTSPSLRTPFPAITNGARACTTPSEPCSPRCPPWSSQLWAAEWSTPRSGAAGWSNSCATWS